jgi:CHAD domain-containing protein
MVRDWAQQFQSWRKLLADCARKPSRGLVHGLRVRTLRLKSEMDQWRRTQPPAVQAHAALKHWAKQAKKLRRVLSEVREIDVHLAKLAGLKTSLASPRGYQLRSSRLPLRELETLRRALKEQRQSAAKRLSGAIESRLDRIEQVSREVESILLQAHSPEAGPEKGAIYDSLRAVARQFPVLDVACLHDFRKRIKSVRYQAELFRNLDPGIRKLAVALKAMQAAAGEWHDWQSLAILAAGRLPDRARNGGLTELLNTLSEESLEKALATCERQIAPYGRPNNPSHAPSLQIVEKKPVQRADDGKHRWVEYVA